MLGDITPYEDLLVVLHSKGGFAYQGMRIATSLLDRSAQCRIMVPVEAKSAATMIALAANEIIMSSGAQLGPVDTQLYYKGTYVSALDMLLSDDRVFRGTARGEIRQCKENIKLLVTDRFRGKNHRTKVNRLVKRFVRLDQRHGSHSAPIFPKEAKGLGLKIQVKEDADVRSLHELYLRSHFCEHDPSTIIECFPFGVEAPADIWEAVKQTAQKDPEGLQKFLTFVKGLTTQEE